jgi:hypothetical protein
MSRSNQKSAIVSEIKRIKGANRAAELSAIARYGPNIGRANVMSSKRDKANDPRRQRKAWSAMADS